MDRPTSPIRSSVTSPARSAQANDESKAPTLANVVEGTLHPRSSQSQPQNSEKVPLGKRRVRESDSPPPAKFARAAPCQLSDLPYELLEKIAGNAAEGTLSPYDEETGDALASAGRILNTLTGAPSSRPMPPTTRVSLSTLGWGFLKGLPESERTLEIYRQCVANDGWALELVPMDLRDDAMHLAAVRQNGRSLECIPRERHTKAIVLAAVLENGLVLEEVREDLVDTAICLAAVLENDDAYAFVPEELEGEVRRLASLHRPVVHDQN